MFECAGPRVFCKSSATSIKNLIQGGEQSGRDTLVARAQWVMAYLHLGLGHCQAAQEAWGAAERIVKAGADVVLGGNAIEAYFWGPNPVSDVIPLCEELIRGPIGGKQANALRLLGGLRAMEGNFAMGLEMVSRATAIYEDLGMAVAAVLGPAEMALFVDLPQSPHRAEMKLRLAYTFLEQLGEKAQLSSVAADWLMLSMSKAITPRLRSYVAPPTSWRRKTTSGLRYSGGVPTPRLWRGLVTLPVR